MPRPSPLCRALYRVGLLLSAGAACLTTAPTKAVVTAGVSRTEYHGWRDCYRFQNEVVDLVFVPQIGRIMRYGRIGGPNLLWENAALAGKVVSPAEQADKWINYGGDKLWPAPQDRWGWPPDATLDRGASTVELTGRRSFRVSGTPSPHNHLRFTRDLELDRTGTGVRIRNQLTNAGTQPAEWSVWEVAQVNDPVEASLPLERKVAFPEGYTIFPNSLPDLTTLRSRDEAIVMTRHPTRGGKIGSPSGEGWAEARIGSDCFRVSCKAEKGATYPDRGCIQEIWSNPDPNKYMELELLGPIEKLKPGESTTFTTRWEIRRL